MMVQLGAAAAPGKERGGGGSHLGRAVAAAEVEATNSSCLEERLPQRCSCPISHCIMDVPVISPGGHSYDQAWISDWLSRRPVDPLSMAPLTAADLYFNRALQEEIRDRLESLVRAAASGGDDTLANLALAKLSKVSSAEDPRPLKPSESWLEQLLRLCACSAVRWCGCVRRQTQTFYTSFGVLGALICDGITYRRSCAAGTPPLEKERPRYLVVQMVRAAFSSSFTPPAHWHRYERQMQFSLQCVFLLPIGTVCFLFFLGGALSVARFVQRCGEARIATQRQDAQSRWLNPLIEWSSAFISLASTALFVRMYTDRRRQLL